jgi:hypothetical protein
VGTLLSGMGLRVEGQLVGSVNVLEPLMVLRVNEQLVRQAGFDIEEAAVVNQDNEDGQFLWITARRVA